MVSFEFVARFSPLDPLTDERVDRMAENLHAVLPEAAAAVSANLNTHELSIIGQDTGRGVLGVLVAVVGQGTTMSFRTLHGDEDPLALELSDEVA